MKSLPGNQGAERRNHLRLYLLSHLRAGLLAWNDLLAPANLVHKLRFLSSDIRQVSTDMIGGAETTDSRRQELRRYINACVKDSILSVPDLRAGKGVERVLGAVSEDIRAVGLEIGKLGAVNALRLIGMSLFGTAEKMSSR